VPIFSFSTSKSCIVWKVKLGQKKGKSRIGEKNKRKIRRINEKPRTFKKG
jgi:hypothetical protein